MKILLVSALAFVLLGALIYRNFFWSRSAKIISNISEKPNQIEEVVKKDTSLKINTMGEGVSLLSENAPQPPSENTPQPPSKNAPNPPSENTPNPRSENTPNPPSENIPNPPSEIIPKPPSENTPNPPSENVLNTSSKNILSSSSENILSSSSENILISSSENVLNTPLLPSRKLKMSSSKVFKNLAFLTQDIETLPYSAKNCQFRDILCPKETLVEVDGKTESLYLHANHVELDGIPMILTQYPLKLHFPLFWRLCENACLVVDLTNDNDMNSGLISYVPQYNQSIFCDNVSISCVSEEALAGLNASLYTYLVDGGDSNAKPYEVKRIHYKAWNDHQGITETDMELLLGYMQQYASLRSQPVVIHCRAGVGRSGTIAVAYAMSYLIKESNVDPSNRIETINRLILEGRKKRGPGFVQNSRQLEAIWKWSEIAIEK